jgi:hypothetical protein
MDQGPQHGPSFVYVFHVRAVQQKKKQKRFKAIRKQGDEIGRIFASWASIYFKVVTHK